MKTVLESSVELLGLSVLAEVAIWEKRPELQRLLASLGKNGLLDAATVAQFLPGLSETGYHNIIHNLEHLRLIGPSGGATALGKRCAQSGEAPAWEIGVYTFAVARHPCFGTWPLWFSRERPDGLDRNYEQLVDVPTWFQPTPESVWASPLEDQTRFTIAALPCERGQSAKCRATGLSATAQLKWKLDLTTGRNAFWVEGSVRVEKGQTQRFRTAESSVPESEIAALYATWEPHWDPRQGRVLMAYDGAGSEDGHDDFLRGMRYKDVSLGGRGTYAEAKVEEIPVGPSGAQEAREWALSLALRHVGMKDGYVTPAEWLAVWQKTVDGTPLAPSAGAAPNWAQLSTETPKIAPRTRWLLAAAADLFMERPVDA